MLLEKFGLAHLSTGDIFRQHIKGETALGVRAKQYMDKGALVPDELTIAMLREKAAELGTVAGFIFDGFPRTTPQAIALDALMAETNTSISACLSLHVADDELVARLLNRGKTSGRADDSNQKVIENRLAVYNRETAPLKEFYAQQNKLWEIDGMGTVDEIFERLRAAVNQLAH